MPAIVAVVILALLAVLQLSLALGAPLGRFAWGGQNRVLTRRLRGTSLVAIVLYAIIAFVLLERSGITNLVSLPPVELVAAWVVTAYLALSILPNAASRSRSERFVMTPVSIVLAVCALLVALG